MSRESNFGLELEEQLGLRKTVQDVRDQITIDIAAYEEMSSDNKTTLFINKLKEYKSTLERGLYGRVR